VAVKWAKPAPFPVIAGVDSLSPGHYPHLSLRAEMIRRQAEHRSAAISTVAHPLCCAQDNGRFEANLLYEER
jgi:hypothetical protein